MIYEKLTFSLCQVDVCILGGFVSGRCWLQHFWSSFMSSSHNNKNSNICINKFSNKFKLLYFLQSKLDLEQNVSQRFLVRGVPEFGKWQRLTLLVTLIMGDNDETTAVGVDRYNCQKLMNVCAKHEFQNFGPVKELVLHKK